MAPESMQSRIASDVARMLPPEAGGMDQNRRTASGGITPVAHGPGSVRLSLERVGWQRFEDFLSDAAGRRLPVTTARNGEVATFQLVDQPLQGTTLEVDRRANAVTVFAPKAMLSGWQKMVQSLDAQHSVPNAVTQVVRVENAEPAPIQRAVRLLGSLEESNGGNAVTRIAGTPFAVAVQQEGDQPPAGDAAEANGPQDEDQVQAAQPAQDGTAAIAAAENLGLIGDVQIQFVPELGIIVLKGSKRDVARVQELIDEIEQKSELTQPEVVVKKLKHINSQAVESLLEELYEEVLSARQGDVSIRSLDKPNALLLIGRAEAVNAAIELIDQLDQPVDPTTQLRIFRLEHASAVDVEETVRGFFVDRPDNDEPRPGLGTRARVVSDYRTNSVVVQASPRDLTEVAELIKNLDVKDAPAQNEVRVIRLRNALAEDLAEVIRSTITASEVEGDENLTPASTGLSILALDAEGNRLLNSGILSGVVVTADDNANALVVRGPSSSMPLLEELIRQLDQTPGTESFVKVFTLENGDAQQLSQALQQLFSAEGGPTGGVGQANLQGLPQASAAGESSLVSLRFSADVRTNSIIASGSASDLEVVESILLRLDTSGFADRMFEVIWLRNQYAPDVATALQNFVNTRQQSLQVIQQAQQGALSPFDALERDVVVVAEPVSNSLIISVAPRLYTTIRRMIDQLDRRAPMVLVKVLIAEVTLTDGFEFGTELGLQDALQFDRGVATLPTAGGGNPQGLPLGPAPGSNPGFNFNDNGATNLNSVGRSSLAERVVTSFGTGTSSSSFGYGGFVLSAASESINLLVRALQDAGRLQILSRPQLMTLDNTEGLVQVGALVPRVTDVVVGGVGNTQIATEDLQVGLILRVTPRVGRDGLIVMNVDAVRSSVDETAPGIPIGFGPNGEPIISPQIQTTQAESVVTAYSGQTVVYGGLIQKTRQQQSRRVPYVSNIPLLGNLFRFDREIEQRSELLVVLTPMVVSSEEDLEYVKQTESSRMSWCLSEVVEMHGEEGLSGGHGLWGPAMAPVIYPDVHPTIDHIEEVYLPENLPPEMFVPEGAEAGSSATGPMSVPQTMPRKGEGPGTPIVPAPAPNPELPPQRPGPLEGSGMIDQGTTVAPARYQQPAPYQPAQPRQRPPGPATNSGANRSTAPRSR